MISGMKNSITGTDIRKENWKGEGNGSVWSFGRAKRATNIAKWTTFCVSRAHVNHENMRASAIEHEGVSQMYQDSPFPRQSLRERPETCSLADS